MINHPDVRRMLMLIKSGTEAMRAVCYSTATSIDYMHRSNDEAIKKEHSVWFALLTPVVKAWCTELAQELTSLAVQIHGGMGFVEETGVAQHYRDARITTIYEGTTGIQAQDLVGRKVIGDNGNAIKELISEMRKISIADDLELSQENYKRSVQDLEQATTWLLNNYKDDVYAPNSIAFNFLMLMGTVCGGWQMLRAATIAKKEIHAGNDETGFYKTKLATARFYCEHFLPRTNAYSQEILAGSESIMSLDENQF